LVLVFVPFKVAPFHVHATGPALLLLLMLLEATLELTFGRLVGRQRLFRNFKDVLETTPSLL